MPNSLSLTIDPAQIADLYARLGRAGASATLVPPITRSTARLQATLATYPPPSRKPQPPRTERQRRYLAILGRQGLIPYRRTGDLGRRWTTDIERTSTGVTGTVGNSVTARVNGQFLSSGTHYAPLVQGSGLQSGYFVGSAWTTDAQALDQNRAAITQDLMGAIQAALG